MNHKKIFVTFWEYDREKAQQCIARLLKEHPEWELVGRHIIGFPAENKVVQHQIADTELTLVLATNSTLNDLTVMADIALGENKIPPNSLLVIWLEKEIGILGVGNALGNSVYLSAGDITGIDGAEDAIERAILQSNRIKETKAPSKPPSSVCHTR